MINATQVKAHSFSVNCLAAVDGTFHTLHPKPETLDPQP